MEETKKWEISSEATSDDGEIDSHNLNDDDDGEDFFDSSDIPKLQFRKDASKARWIDDLRMAVLVERKGKLWTTTGIVRDGQIYCSVYETLYLVEIGALHVVDGGDMPLSIKDIYLKVLGVESRFSWESFEAYKHLKALGYIVGQHNIPWTMKSAKVDADTSQGASEINEESPNSSSSVFVGRSFEHLQIDDVVMPLFDVYLPNSKFKKSSPGSSLFVLCPTSGHPPSNREIEKLERRCSGKPLKFFNVDHGRWWTQDLGYEGGNKIFKGAFSDQVRAVVRP